MTSGGGSGDRRERKLDPLLAGEVEKRLPVLSPGGDVMDVRAALHSLKGSLARAISAATARAASANGPNAKTKRSRSRSSSATRVA